MGFHRSKEKKQVVKLNSVLLTQPDKLRFQVDSLLSILSEPDETSVEISEKLSAPCSEISMRLSFCTCKKHSRESKVPLSFNRLNEMQLKTKFSVTKNYFLWSTNVSIDCAKDLFFHGILQEQMIFSCLI